MSRIVSLPSIGVRRHRIFLTERPNSRQLPMPAIFRARRALGQAHTTPPVALPDTHLRSQSQVGWSLASVALMVAVVLIAWTACR
jgi:hypothetical protein